MARSEHEALRFLFSEVKDHHIVVLDWLRELNGRAESLLRVNVLITGILATVVSLLLRFAPAPLTTLQGVLFAVGLVLLVFSTLLAVFSYLNRGISGGLDPQEIDSALDYELDLQPMVADAVRAYHAGILRNEGIMERAARRFRLSLYLLSGAIVVLTIVAGTYLGRGIQ